MAWLKKVDHITYAVAKGMIEKWAWYHIEIEGGKLIKRVDNVTPNNPYSSMKLWCIDFGTFGIALVEGIDREEKSQVTSFVEKHGDHSVQHVAYDTEELDKFVEHLTNYGGRPRGEILHRHDGFGKLKQLFCKGYSGTDPAQMPFPEYVERHQFSQSKELKITFSQEAGKGFYQQVENACKLDDTETLIDFVHMPSNWEPPVLAALEN